MIRIENATVRYRNRELFSRLTLDIHENEHWAVVGPGGSGKSALLQTLAGRYAVCGGNIQYPFYERYRQAHALKDPLFSAHRLMAYVDARHDFKNLSNTRDFYYQQRFNAGYADNAQRVRDYLDEQGRGRQGPWDLDRVVRTFGLAPLAHKHLIKLSNGETKRLRIGAALLKNPCLLLLDNPLAGLDPKTRTAFEDIFNQIAASGICLVITAHPDEIPSVITHVADLPPGGPVRTMPKQAFTPVAAPSQSLSSPESDRLQKLMQRRESIRFNVLVAMNSAKVAYGSKTIFENISWTVRPGDCWALTGPNGSGKTTLLSLINGDHPQAYANDIVLFDRKRGTGESIWDIKRKIGFVSPELHQFFPRHFTCSQVVESGFYDTIGLFTQSRPEHREIAEKWLDIMGLARLCHEVLGTISASHQRLCLLARALVKTPYLLMLDEPCLGFDRDQQTRFRNLVDRIAETSDMGIIYVTHHHETLPAAVNKTLRLSSNPS